MISLCFLSLVSTALAGVVHVTDKSFASEVMKHEGVVIVEFYAPWCGHCKSLAPEYEKAASTLAGVVKVVAVDATENQQLAQKYKIEGFPSLKVFGEDKKKPTDYQGGRTADAIITETMKMTNALVKGRKSGGGAKKEKDTSSKPKDSKKAGGKGKVVELTEDSFQSSVLDSQDLWLVEFYAPWCGHCKNLAPEWKDAASQLGDTAIHLGAVDATVHSNLGSTYGVKGYPTIKMFPAGKKTKRSATDYQGPREAPGIVSFALDTYEKQVGATPVELTQLTSEDTFQEKCGSKICVVVFLPNIFDSNAAERKKYLSLVEEVGGKMRGKPISFVWTEGGAQPALEEVLEVNGNTPSIGVISLDKKAGAISRRSWNKANVQSFVEGVLTGGMKGEKIRPLPAGASTSCVTSAAWDGKDAVYESEEEELSLEDIMGE